MPKPIAAAELGRLLDRHGAALVWYAAQWSSLAEDCVQEAFIELAAQPNCPTNPVAWLYHVVRNRSLNALRSERRRSNHEREACSQRRPPEATDQRLTDESELHLALQRLPSEEREWIVLRIWSELTWQQIGDLTGTSSSTAHRRYLTAMNLLKEELESLEKPPPNIERAPPASSKPLTHPRSEAAYEI